MSKINLGIIGAGVTAEEHIKVLNKINNFILYGITSKTNKRCSFLKKKYGIKNIYKSYKQMIKDSKIDAFFVVVSAKNNFEVLSNIIPTKKSFFTEKPVGINLNQNKKILQLIKKHKNLNMVGLNRRFYSIFHKGLDIINNNGGLLGFEIHGHERFWQKKHLNKEIKRNWHHVNSIHTIDLLAFFGGKYLKKNILSKKNKSKKNNNIISNFLFKNGLIGSYSSFWDSPGGWNIKLYGNKITIVFEPLEKGFVINKNFKIKKIQPSKYDINFKPGYYNQIIEFKNLLLRSKLEWPAVDIKNYFYSAKLTSDISNE